MRMTILTARTLTPAALAWLAEAPAPRVLGVFERACDLVDAAGRVLALVTSEASLAPFGVVLAGAAHPFTSLTAASSVTVAPGALRVGALTIHVDGAALWDPRPDWAALRPRLGPDRIDWLAGLALRIGKPGSLLAILEAGPPPVREASSHGGPAPQRREGWEEGGLALIGGLRSRSLEMSLAGARALAGLGTGLTPAGDDFIVGALLAAWAGAFGADVAALGAPLAEAAAVRTTTLSAAYLRAAALGECAAPWHRLLTALVAASEPEINAALRALLAVGHTSGADGLAGFLAAWRLAAEESLP